MDSLAFQSSQFCQAIKHVHLMVRLCHYQANGQIKVMIGLGFKLSYGPYQVMGPYQVTISRPGHVTVTLKVFSLKPCKDHHDMNTLMIEQDRIVKK